MIARNVEGRKIKEKRLSGLSYVVGVGGWVFCKAGRKKQNKNLPCPPPPNPHRHSSPPLLTASFLFPFSFLNLYPFTPTSFPSHPLSPLSPKKRLSLTYPTPFPAPEMESGEAMRNMPRARDSIPLLPNRPMEWKKRRKKKKKRGMKLRHTQRAQERPN